MGKCMNCWHGKYEHLWFKNPWYGIHGFYGILEKFKDAYLVVLLGKLMQNTLASNGLEDFENMVYIW